MEVSARTPSHLISKMQPGSSNGFDRMASIGRIVRGSSADGNVRACIAWLLFPLAQYGLAEGQHIFHGFSIGKVDRIAYYRRLDGDNRMPMGVFATRIGTGRNCTVFPFGMMMANWTVLPVVVMETATAEWPRVGTAGTIRPSISSSCGR
jgi:hypothetical protein